MGTLVSALRSFVVHRMIADKSLYFERLVMSPKYHSKEEYESGMHGFVTLDEAARFLNMNQRAFDLLVAAHRDIFTRIMKYDKRWLIPDLYLEELSQNEDFLLVKAKYELLAKRVGYVRRIVPTTDPEKRGRRQPGLQAGSGKQTFPHEVMYLEGSSADSNKGLLSHAGFAISATERNCEQASFLGESDSWKPSGNPAF